MIRTKSSLSIFDVLEKLGVKFDYCNAAIVKSSEATSDLHVTTVRLLHIDEKSFEQFGDVFGEEDWIEQL